MQRNKFDELKLLTDIVLHRTKNPLPVSRRGLYDICDDVVLPLICPTRQALCDLVWPILVWRIDIYAKSLDAGWQIGRPPERKEAIDVFRCYRARNPVGPVPCGKPS